MNGEDRDLGMGRNITRRDFVQGVAVAGAVAGFAPGALAASAPRTPVGLETDAAGTYPPLRTGMRGMHPGAFEAAHALRDGEKPPAPIDTRETYDLVVVGGGLSGLSAAWYFRQAAGPSARILVLDNHDDFGGHAKRNEFVYQGRKMVATGGSAYMVAPKSWTRDAIGMIDALGIDWKNGRVSSGPSPAAKLGLKSAAFFRKEVYGKDQLVVGGSFGNPTQEFLGRTPLPAPLQADILRLMHGKTDYMAGMTTDQKIAKLRSISYRTYLLEVAKFGPDVLAFTEGVWCLGNDMASAWLAYFRGKPGFAGLGIPMPYGSPESAEQESADFALPAGNSDIARLIVRSLIPDALVAGPWEQIETARVNYAALDKEGAPTRIRLSSIVVSARHLGATPHQFEPDGREVEIAYMHGGKGYAVRAQNVVMAGMNNMVPYICPDMPDKQKAALHTAVRACNQSTNVMFRNWEAFAQLGISGVSYPNSFYGGMRLNFGRPTGGLAVSEDPSQPVLVGFNTAANSGIAANPTMMSELLGGASIPPGTPMDDQFRAIRAGLLQTPFEHFERAVRGQAAAALAGSKFDPARDILAITVNRWPHGFATGRNVLFDQIDPQDDLSPPLIAKQKFGRIAIANSDASGVGIAQTAIDEACRAVRDLQPRTYGYYETF
jgi:spermidine dehydrogenase